MARDMWSMINRELAKIESAGGGRSATPQLDILKETMQYAKEDRAWKERKGYQRQELMKNLAYGTSLTFNDDDLKDKKARFQKYYDRHKGSMDEASLELGQMYLENYDMQAEKNKDFRFLEGEGEQLKKDMLYDMNNIGVDEEGNPRTLDENDYEIITDMQKRWIDHTSKMQTQFADRLSLKPFQHINAELTNATNTNQFLLTQAREDNLIDDKELQAWSDSWNTGNLDAIDHYNNNEKAGKAASIQFNTTELLTGAKRYSQLYNLLENDGVISYKDQQSGQTINVTAEQLKSQIGGKKILSGLISEYDSLPQQLKNLNNTNIDLTGTDFLKTADLSLHDIPPNIREQILAGDKTILDVPQVKEAKEDQGKVQAALGLDSEDYKEISGDIKSAATAVGIAGAPYGVVKTAEATKWLANKTNKGARYIKSSINLSPTQVEEFLNSKAVKNTSAKLDKLEKGLKGLKKGSPDYETIKTQINNIKNGQTKFWAKKFNVDEADMGRLYKTGNRSKWNVFKMRRNLTKRFPKFAGKLGGRYVIGSTLTDIAGFETEGKTRMAIDFSTGYVAEKMTTKKFLPTLRKILTTPRGQKVLMKFMSKQAAKRVAQVGAGTVVPGWGNIAMALIGAGLTAYDMTQLVKNYNEEEE